MALFQPDWVRKQRHSKAIIRRNNLQRQLLLKQDEPDVGDISESSEGSLPEGVVPVYWRAHQADGYDSRLKWRRGPNGRFYYDSREGSRTFGRDDIFLNDEERDEVIEKLSEFRGGAVNSMAASQIYDVALTGSTGDHYASNIMDTYVRLVAQHQGQGSTPDAIRQTIESGAVNIHSRYESDLRDQGIFTTSYVNDTASEDPELNEYREAELDPSEEDGEHTYPVQETADEDARNVRDMPDEVESPPVGINGVLEVVVDEGVLSIKYHGQKQIANRSFQTVEEALFQSYVSRGALEQQAWPMMMSTDADIMIEPLVEHENMSMGDWVNHIQNGGDVLRSDRGNQQISNVPDILHQRMGLTGASTISSRGQIVPVASEGARRITQQEYESTEPSPSQSREAPDTARQSHGVSEEVYERLGDWGKASLANDTLISSNRELFNSLTQVLVIDAGDAVVPPSHFEAGAAVSNKRAGKPLKAAQRRMKTEAFPEGVYSGSWRTRAIAKDMFEQANLIVKAYNTSVDIGDIEGPKKREATTLSWDEWMEERDKTFQALVQHQAQNDAKKRAKNEPVLEAPLRVGLFESQAGGVVGTPTQGWVNKFKDIVKDRFEKIQKTDTSEIPSSFAVWPPSTSSEEARDNPSGYQVKSSRYPETMYALVYAWMEYNRTVLGDKNPVSAANMQSWGFGQDRAFGTMRQIAAGSSGSNTIISTDRNGEVAAALNYDPGSTNWYVGSLGANIKNFTIYPANQINAALEANAQNENLSRNDRKRARTLLRRWRRTGLRHPHRTIRGSVESGHGQWVINEFLRQFLSSNAQTASCSPIGGSGGYVGDHYNRLGFANGRSATRLNLLWTALLQAPDYVPRDRDGNVIQKSFEVAYHKNHDTIVKDPSLNRLQSMLDTLMKDKKPSFSEEELIAMEEEETRKHFSEFLGMNEQEYDEFVESFNLWTGSSSQEEDSE